MQSYYFIFVNADVVIPGLGNTIRLKGDFVHKGTYFLEFQGRK